jgi:hypothetical protein
MRRLSVQERVLFEAPPCGVLAGIGRDNDAHPHSPLVLGDLDSARHRPAGSVVHSDLAGPAGMRRSRRTQEYVT